MPTFYKEPKFFNLRNISKNPSEVKQLIVGAHGFACSERLFDRKTHLLILGQYTSDSLPFLRRNNGSILILSKPDDRITEMQQQWARERYESIEQKFKPQRIVLPDNPDYNGIYEAVNRYFINDIRFAEGDQLAAEFVEKCKTPYDNISQVKE